MTNHDEIAHFGIFSEQTIFIFGLARTALELKIENGEWKINLRDKFN